jgi:Saxitoxin biosynthesis operon protein SxtJ
MRDKYFGSHEFQRRDEAVKTSSNRSFGLVFAAFFAFLAALSFWHGTNRWPIWLACACVALVLALAAPRLLAPFNWAWTKLGLLLHRILSPIFLTVLFYGCIAPVGFLMRLSGKDPLRLKYEPAVESYWIVRSPPGPSPASFKHQF